MYNLNFQQFAFSKPEPAEAEQVLATVAMAKMQKEGRSWSVFNVEKLKIKPEKIAIWQDLLLDADHLHYFATAPGFASVHPLFDRNDRQICGFGGLHKPKNTPHARLTNLFTVKSCHDTGQALLALFIQDAKINGYQSIQLNPLNYKAFDWYKERGFEKMPSTNRICRNPDQVLWAHSFDNALEIMERKQQERLSQKQNHQKALDFQPRFP